MKEGNREVEIPKQNIVFDWKAFIGFLLDTAGERDKLGPAWFLFFDIAQNSDRVGIYANTYSKLEKRYGVAKVTVKTWRRHLHQQGVIESYSRGHSVVFRLLEPYMSFLKQVKSEKSGQVEGMEDLLALKKLLLKAVADGQIKTAA